MDKAIICDLDSTLTDVEHRVHFVKGEEIDWKSFSDAMVDDTLNEWCFEIISTMRKSGYKIIFVSGRGEKYRKVTEDWLKKFNVEYDHLFLRARKDYREDPEIKKEIYLNNIKDKYEVLFVMDDRKSVVEMWRNIGLICLQPAWGDF